MSQATAYVWTAESLSQATGGTWHQLNTPIHTQRITTDTRQLQAGDVFLAIRGERFDAHEFIDTAKQAGAVAAIVERPLACDLPQLVVADSKLALGALGGFRRRAHPDLTVVALTGSSGKTTTKQMLGSIFSQIAPTLMTRGNLNNDLGVPMMLLELRDEQRFAVMELGANHLGEIAYTANLVRPTVACVLNIGTAHLGEFGGRDNIAAAKAEIYSALDNQGTAILPLGDDYFEFLMQQAQQFTQSTVSFGEKAVPLPDSGLSEADKSMLSEQGVEHVLMMGDVFADDVEIFPTHCTFTLGLNLKAGEVATSPVQLPFIGEHNVVNALAAAAAAAALGVDLPTIVAGLEQAEAPKGRLTRLAWGEHTLIDDTYNANPTSMIAAAKVLQSEENQKILVLGDIFELGAQADLEHRKLGKALAQLEIDAVFAVGEQMAHMAAALNEHKPIAQHFDDKQALLAALQAQLQQAPATVLFKGSRGMAMESLIDALMTDKK